MSPPKSRQRPDSLKFRVFGVGGSRRASIASDFPCPLPLPCPAFMRSVHASHVSGVYALPMSLTAGVGRSVTVVRRSRPPDPCTPDPLPSDTVGVGSRVGEQEHPVPPVRCSHVGSA